MLRSLTLLTLALQAIFTCPSTAQTPLRLLAVKEINYSGPASGNDSTHIYYPNSTIAGTDTQYHNEVLNYDSLVTLYNNASYTGRGVKLRWVNAQNQPIKILEKKLYAGVLKTVWLDSMTYNAAGLLSERFTYTYDNDTLVHAFATHSYYNQAGKKIIDSINAFDKVNVTFKPYQKEVLEYNNNMQPTKHIFKNYNPTTLQFDTIASYQITYNAQGLADTMTYTEWYNNTANPTQREVYHYNSNNQLQSLHNWEAQNNTFVGSASLIKDFYYNNLGYLIADTLSAKTSATSNYTTRFINQYTYHNNQLVAAYAAGTEPDSLTLKPYKLDSFYYNATGHKTKAIYKLWSMANAAWYASQAFQYYYEPYTPNGITGKAVESVTLMVYPNPANNLLRLAWPKQLGNGSIYLYSTDGRLMHSQAIRAEENFAVLSIAHLPIGLYHIVLSLEGGSSSAVIQKQ